MFERRSRLAARTQSELLKLFVAGVTARAAAGLTGVQANTAARFFVRLRRLIAAELPSYDLSGEVEADESYFGGVRKGKRGRGAAGKVAVFGLLKRGGKVYTAVVPDARSGTILPIIRERVRPDSIVDTDAFRSYNAPDVSDFRHKRINHCAKFASGRNHINGIENFWSQAKRHLRRFNGIRPQSFYWFLKECEWRFNGGDHKMLLNQLRKWFRAAKR